MTNPKREFGLQKVPMRAVPPAVLAEVGVAMLEGELKYGRYNFRATKIQATDYYDSTQRHLMDWFEGEDIDPKSQLSHITKAIAGLVVLRDAQIQGMFIDDRPPSSRVPALARLEALVAELYERYDEKSPRHYTIADTTHEVPRILLEEPWIEWCGGDCPVDPERIVEFKLRSGPIDTSRARYLRWDVHKRNPEGDIIAYRVLPE